MCTLQLKIGFFGLGTMGNAMAKNLLKKATTPRETVIDADVILSCLYDDKSCLTVAQGGNGYLSGVKKDAIHLNTTTITPKTAIQLQKLHEQYHTHCTAAPITGRPEGAHVGQLSNSLGGNRHSFERVRSIINCYSRGSVVIVGEEPAQANVVKLTENMLILSNISLFGQIYALNERWNINHDITSQIIKMFYSHPDLLSYEERLRNRNYDKPIEGEYGVEGGLKDINAILSTGDEVAVPLSFCRIMKEQYLSIMNYGLKDKDWSALGDTTEINAGLVSSSEQKK